MKWELELLVPGPAPVEEGKKVPKVTHVVQLNMFGFGWQEKECAAKKPPLFFRGGPARFNIAVRRARWSSFRRKMARLYWEALPPKDNPGKDL